MFNEVEKLAQKVKIEGISTRKVYFDIGGVKLTLYNAKGYGLTVQCTCKHHSMNYNRGLCRFKLALLYFLIKNWRRLRDIYYSTNSE